MTRIAPPAKEIKPVDVDKDDKPTVNMENTSGLMASNNKDNEEGNCRGEEHLKLIKRQQDAQEKADQFLDTLSKLPDDEETKPLMGMIQMANNIIRPISSESPLLKRKTLVEQYEVSIGLIEYTIKSIVERTSGLVASNNEGMASSVITTMDDKSEIGGIVNIVKDGKHTKISGWVDNQTTVTISGNFIEPSGLGRNKDS